MIYLVLAAADAEAVDIGLDQFDKIVVVLAHSANGFTIAMVIVLSSTIRALELVLGAVDPTSELNVRACL